MFAGVCLHVDLQKVWKDAHQTVDGYLWRGKWEWRGMIIFAFPASVLFEFFFMDNLFN